MPILILEEVATNIRRAVAALYAAKDGSRDFALAQQALRRMVQKAAIDHTRLQEAVLSCSYALVIRCTKPEIRISGEMLPGYPVTARLQAILSSGEYYTYPDTMRMYY